MTQKTALITGITGQDGSYLAELLLANNYRVCGVAREASQTLILHGRPTEHLEIHACDLQNTDEIGDLVAAVQPDEVYNLAAVSYIPAAWDNPLMSGEVTGMATMRLLEAVRRHCPAARVFQAGSADMYGNVTQAPQNENTPLDPLSPYGIAKAFAYHTTRMYRERFGLFACCGILFNHESPRRGPQFVTRKITQGVAQIKHGLASQLSLGNLQAQRDWGFAGDFVRAMWLMLQQDEPADYVIGTGRSHTVEDFVRLAFAHADLDWRDYVVIDPAMHRPETKQLCADTTRIQRHVGWKPKVTFEQLVAMMVEHDLRMVQRAA